MEDHKVVLTERDEQLYYDNYNKRFINGIFSNIEEVPQNISDSYYNYVAFTAKLIHRLAGKYNNTELGPFVYVAIFYELLRTGNLSLNGKFEFGSSPKENTQLLGFTIANGNGVCRNIASLLRDVLNEIANKVNNLYKSYVFITNSDMFNRTGFKKAPLAVSQTYISSNAEEDPRDPNAFNNKPNHLDVLCGAILNGELRFIIFDPTNFHMENLAITSSQNRNKFTQELGLIANFYFQDNCHIYKTNDKDILTEKMSKDVQRVLTIQKALERYEPVNVPEHLIDNIYELGVRSIKDNLYDPDKNNRIDTYHKYVKRFQEILCNYLNTNERPPQAK